MVPGFNTDLVHRGKTYHIQTEDLGADNPHVLTLVYVDGAVLARMKTNYRELLGPNPTDQVVSELMTRQHRQVQARVQAGELARRSHAGQLPSTEELIEVILEYLADEDPATSHP